MVPAPVVKEWAVLLPMVQFNICLEKKTWLV